MRNIKFTIAYDGTNYFGWQRQKNHVSIQQIIEETLCGIINEQVKVIGMGRTDTGVHAKSQIANVKILAKIGLKNLHAALNSKLPRDIVVLKVQEVSSDFHAIRSPKTKTYRYTIYNGNIRSVFDGKHVLFYPFKIDFDLMKKAVSYLKGTHDFSCFRSSNSTSKTSVRTVYDVSLNKRGNYLYFDIEANGFLYNMVRIIVGTLLEIGRGKRKPSDIKELIKSRKRTLAGQTAKACGLCLLKVKF